MTGRTKAYEEISSSLELDNIDDDIKELIDYMSKALLHWPKNIFDITEGDYISVKCLGYEYISFLKEDSIWPEGRVIIQMANLIDGDWMPEDLRLEDIKPDAIIEITDQGGVHDAKTDEQWNIVNYFNKWKKSNIT